MIAQEKCFICNGGEYSVLLPQIPRFGLAELVRCKGCGTTRFFFASEFWERRQRSQFWDTDVHYEAYIDSAVLEQFFQRYSRYLPHLRDLAGEKLLDIGCGLGTFLQFAKAHGFQVAGLESDPKAAEIARKKVDCEVVTATIETSSFQDASFDIIVMWDVIEHLVDPRAAIERVAKMLRPGGKLVIETPNERFFMRGVTRFVEKLSGYRLRVAKYFYYVEHKFYFNPANITRFLQGMGFDTVQVFQDKSISLREQKIFSRGKFPLAGLAMRMIPLVLAMSNLLPNQNKMVVIARRVK